MKETDSRRQFVKKTGLFMLASSIIPDRAKRLFASPATDSPFDISDYPSPPIHDKSNWIDVTKAPYSADKTGKTDCTSALLRAMKDLRVLSRGRTSHYNVLSALYFPNGVYLVSDKLTFGEGRARSMQIRGESKEGTIIRLKPNASGFQNPDKPKPLITFFDSSGGHANDAFNNAIDNLTVEIGPGNPGAVGVVFHNNNNGYIKGLAIKSTDGAGVDGLQLTYGAGGIGYIKDLSITGFDYGITLAHHKIAYVFEYVQLNGQGKAGFHNDGKPVQIRCLLSNNKVPAIQNVNQGGQIVLLDSHLRGQQGRVAIDNRAGALFVRNVVTSGYECSIKDRDESIPAARIKEYNSGPIYTLWEDTPKTSLNLPIKETPAIPWEAPSDWATVSPSRNEDDTDAIQAAIDSGKRTVCLLPGTYRISRPIQLRGSVERLYGSYAHLRIPEARTKLDPEDKFAVVVEDSKIPVRIIEMLSCGCIHNKSNQTLVLRFVQCQGYRNTGYGDLFLEGVQGDLTGLCNTTVRMPVWYFKDQNVWVRHINPEGAYPHITNDGGQLWVMGYKVGERLGPYIVSRNGARTEILGGYCNALSAVPDEQRAMFINDNSDMTLIAAEGVAVWHGPDAESPAAVAIREFRNGQERSISHDAIMKRENNANKGGLIPFYNGRSAVRPGPTYVTIESLNHASARPGSIKATLRISRKGAPASDLTVYLCIDGDSTFVPGEYPPIPSSVTIPAGQSSVDLELDTTLDAHAANGRRELTVALVCGPEYRIEEDARSARFTLENSNVDINKGLCLHCPFDESTREDRSVSKYHIEAANNVRLTRDGDRPAAEFGKNSSLVICTKFKSDQSTFLRIFADKTISLWVNPREVDSQQIIYTDGCRMNGLRLSINNGSIEAKYHERVGVGSIVKNDLKANQWQHVAIIMSHGALSLHLDGELIGTQYAPAILLDYTYQRNVVAGLGMDSFQGMLADFRVYERPLNRAEVVTLQTLNLKAR